MTEVIIADAGLEDLDQLLGHGRPELRTLLVSATEDAHAVLAAVLADRPTAVHLVAHGEPGRIRLGATPLDAGSLLDRSWPDAQGTEIHIHACRVADGETGRAFLNRLAAATGATVAASSRPVGPAEQGGSWQLDVRTAPVLAASPFVGAETWAHVLAVVPGTPGNDTLTSAADADSLVGGAGNDTLIGGGGNDTLNGGLGADQMDGGDDFDSVTYEDATTAIRLDLLNPATSTGEAAGDTFTNVEHWIGGAFNDTMVAGNDAVWFWGHGGDDLEYGGTGNDTLESGDGNDTIYGGAGNDHVFGRADLDTLFGDAGDDLMAGGGGADSMEGGAGNDTLIGDWDADTMIGGDGDDTFYSGEHTDRASGTAYDEADSISGGAGNDTYIIAGQSDAGTVTFDGGTGTDTLRISSVTVTDPESVIYDTNNPQPKLNTVATPAIDISGMRLTSVERLDLVGTPFHTVTMTGAQANGFTEGVSGARVGDAFKIVGATMSGTVGSGNGSTLTAGQAQAETVNGVTLLHIGTDATAGGDVTLRFAGSFTAGQFQVSGDTVTLVTAPTTTPPDTTPPTTTPPTTTPPDTTPPTTTPPTTTPPTTTPSTDMQRTVGGVAETVKASAYSGPVSSLKWSFMGDDRGEALSGSADNDFINMLGGDDAANGQSGDDVLDGGAGSNFLTGGAGSDTFFVDARGGLTTWSTVTDLDKGEWATLWGYNPGTSKLTWEEMGGADGYKGATAHVDIDGNGSIDASMTFTGKSVGAMTFTTGNSDGNNYIAFINL
ncbi:DUF4347 domain-containing protein [Azospirillum rugosum]|uniref:Ca2+-binding RTX toxin-like protein n=1 Tax=Azospirillum rugosum TaxID=416170 RepID=A0ABS4SP45_9PROT|nr:DUF4347 domain-containing protein [Azospirillum rugosum]MBP2294336.1 Ca2+-binding RTX toxin-like protein [Azospirillum rugosum]MDQ0527671.1 Ca2+-binding RTX toxin-like protein [Azospirillum rugosum]